MAARSKRGGVTRRALLLRSALGAGVGIAAGGAAYGFAYERHRIGVTRLTLPVRSLPAGLAGLRIGLLTDLHRSATVSEELATEATTLLLAERPDLVVLGGDYVSWHDSRYAGAAAEALGQLWAPHGVFAVLGNHDDERTLTRALTARRITVLRDARTRIRIRNEAVDLVGLRFWTRDAGEVARAMHGSAAPVILLAHDPRRIDEAARAGVSLVLSGHTHGGQIVLPAVSAFVVRRFPIAAGMLRRGDTTLFVSRGVGTVYVPVRWNCPPEVAILTLASA